MTDDANRYLAFLGRAPKRIPHWEHWSCPDAETYLTGIDYYEHPRLCRLRLRELYPQLELSVPETDAPRPRPRLDLEGKSSTVDDVHRQPHPVERAAAGDQAVSGSVRRFRVAVM